MKSPLKDRIFWPVLTAALASVLIVLGTVQYRWSQEVSHATTTRLRATLSSSMLAFRQDFARELSSIIATFQTVGDDGSVSTDLKQEAVQFQEWKKTTSHPGLVKSVYVAKELSPRQLQLLRLNGESTFEKVSWPVELNGLQTALGQLATYGPKAIHFLGRGPHPPGDSDDFHRPPEMGRRGDYRRRPPAEPQSSGGHSQQEAYGRDLRGNRTQNYVYLQGNGAPGPSSTWPEGARGIIEFRASNDGRREANGPRFLRRIPWFIDGSIPALISPVISISFSHQPPERSVHWIIVELDQDFLRTHLFPELAARYFPGGDALGYDVAVVNDERGVRDIFASSGPLSQKDADARLDLFGAAGPPLWMDAALPHFQNGQQPVASKIHDAGVGEAPLLPARIWMESGNWQLVVKNRQGSLEAAVSGLRKRQLALSFGILLVLAVTMGVVVMASRRAQNLARLQMDFVAGVSHELRTPLAVISSAAENIADGLVDNKQQISRYGKVIKSQSAQLRQLVEQILLFASTRHRGQQYRLQPTDPSSVIDVALENTAEVIRNAEITIEKNIEPNLPPVLIDRQALAQCLQNLITNAVKYGGEARWLGVTAARQQSGPRNEVAITISDRGIGIEPEELKHVFDAFYRGAAVRAAQIHGSGLGLPLAKSIVEAMGGRITVQSTPGTGSSFTVHVPVPTLAVAGNGVLTAAMNPKRLIENHE